MKKKKLYSTGDEELDDLLERAFCEGYEYAQREFSKNDEEDDKLSREDERDIKRYQRSKSARKNAELGIAAYEGDKDAQKKLRRKITAAGGAMGALSGAISGSMIGSSHGKSKGLIGGAIGAAAGGAFGAGAANRLARSTEHGKKYNESRSSSDVKIAISLQKDKLKVAKGEMSKKEFKDKWGK